MYDVQDETDPEHSEERLRASELRYRRLFETAKDGILILDAKTGKITDANPFLIDLLGYSLDEFIGAQLWEIGPFKDVKECKLAFAELQEKEYIRYESLPLQTKDGRSIAVEFVSNVYSLNAGARVIQCNIRDITQRKQMEEALRQSEERFRVALKNSRIAVFSQDRDLHYTWSYNSDLRVGEELERTLDELLETADAASDTKVRRQVLETGMAARADMQIAYGGRKRYYDVAIEPVLDSAGAVIGLTGVRIDVTDLRETTEALREAKKKLTEEKLYLEQEIDTELGFGEIVGRSKALQTVMENVRTVATTDATVLLMGETGTGKEMVARAIHRTSKRCETSFIKMNCAAIPSGLLESELFGHEKGAFTGAVSKKTGRLELADKGTLFLDEIGEIPLELQPKLLRVLQDQEFERLGGLKTLKVNFRLIAATNRDLEEAVRDNEFRSDLYYRLKVFPIRIPPLRERREDIRLLVEHFVKKFCLRMNKSITSVPKRTMDALSGLDWPGNVRELENIIERAVILTQGSVLVVPLSEIMLIQQELSKDRTQGATERDQILRALRESHGQIGGVSGAAGRLGMKRTTLQSKMKHMGIDPASERPQ
ncbi:MAG: sigma 54-interacting transcriptional regulator [Candidatus Sulfotelmatobacter sp.]